MQAVAHADLKPIHVLLIEEKDNGYWSAQCLEYDIATQAKSFLDIMKEVQRVLNCHIAYAEKHKTKPFANLKSAPAAFWKMFFYAGKSPFEPMGEKALNDSVRTPIAGWHVYGRPEPCHAYRVLNHNGFVKYIIIEEWYNKGVQAGIDLCKQEYGQRDKIVQQGLADLTLQRTRLKGVRQMLRTIHDLLEGIEGSRH